MHIIIGLALGLTIGGLVVMLLAAKAIDNATLKTVFWWVGLIVALCGLFLLISPIVVWISGQLKAMLGV